MRILIAAPWIPYSPRSGMTIRITEIARRLGREHDVTFAVATRAQPDFEYCEALRREGFGVIALPGNRGANAFFESLYAFVRGRPPRQRRLRIARLGKTAAVQLGILRCN